MTRSSAEVEYMSMALGVCELSWVNKVMEEPGFPKKGSLLLYSDNKVAISIVNNPVQHHMIKHIEINGMS